MEVTSSFILMMMMTTMLIGLVSADCPDQTLRCPTGESFTVGTCWSWSKFQCEVCHSITNEMRRFCRSFSCRGSTSNWYGRNDGCSASILTGPLTDVFGEACGIHDLCYATPGRTKRQCDLDFKYNLRRICRFPGIGNIGYLFCLSTAEIMYGVVRDHGQNFPDFAASCTES